MRVETSVKVYRILIRVDTTLEEIAYNNTNCIISTKSKWRCTLHRRDFTMNIFQASKLSIPAIVVILFTKTKPLDEIEKELTELFGVRPDMEATKLLNWVVKIYTDYKNLDLDDLFDDLDEFKQQQLDNIFIVKGAEKKGPKKIARYDMGDDYPDSSSDCEMENEDKPECVGDSPDLAIDKQRFSALIITPFPEETNMTIELYSSGVLNCAGIPNEHIMEKTKHYVNNILVPLFRKNLS